MNKAWKAAAAKTRLEMSAFTAAGSATIRDPSAGDYVGGERAEGKTHWSGQPSERQH